MNFQLGEIKRGQEIGLHPYIKYIWLPCGICGKFRWVRLLRGEPRSKFCPHCVNKVRKGNNHPRWHNGEFVDANGYVRVLCPEHPHCDSKGYVYKHRLIMEILLGRFLNSEEVIHHIDGDKQNNEPSNLMPLESTAIHSALHKG